MLLHPTPQGDECRDLAKQTITVVCFEDAKSISLDGTALCCGVQRKRLVPIALFGRLPFAGTYSESIV